MSCDLRILLVARSCCSCVYELKHIRTSNTLAEQERPDEGGITEKSGIDVYPCTIRNIRGLLRVENQGGIPGEVIQTRFKVYTAHIIYSMKLSLNTPLGLCSHTDTHTHMFGFTTYGHGCSLAMHVSLPNQDGNPMWVQSPNGGHLCLLYLSPGRSDFRWRMPAA